MQSPPHQNFKNLQVNIATNFFLGFLVVYSRNCREISEAIDKCKAEDSKVEEQEASKLPKASGGSGNSVVTEALVSKDAPMPIHGDSVTYNMNKVLRDAVLASQYFRELLNIRSLDALIEEICKNVMHVEPWIQAGSTIPSTMSCCLVRLFTMRPSGKQMVTKRTTCSL